MENKFYTPDLTEFHVGFEYEFLQHHGSPEQEWIPLTLTQISDGEDDARLGLTFKALENYDNVYIRNAWRVKYLDQSDIESFGFECTGVHVDELEFEVDEETFLTLEPDGYVRIADYGEGDVTRFSGVIKNKSELNKLLKQLNIIE